MSAGADLRLVHVRIEGYGRLRDFAFDPDPVPGMIVRAPNEAGKSTLVSAIHRGLFGFEDKSREDARRPWESSPFRIGLRWALGADTLCTVVRDFDTREVCVEWRRRNADGGTVLDRRWEGSPNPRGRSIELDEYRAELKRLLGFSSPQIFLQTALVGPGGPDTRPLEAELLRLLSGGERADFRAALEALAAGYYELTQAGLENPSRQAKHKPRRLEELEAGRRELERRLREALAAGHARREAEESLARIQDERSRVEAELAEQVRTRQVLDRLGRVRADIAAAEWRLGELDARAEGFRQWEETFRLRELDLRPLAGYLGKPPEYAQRLAELESLDRELGARREALRRAESRPPERNRRARVIGLSAGVWIGAGAAAFILEAPPQWAAVLAGVGLALLLLAGWMAFRARPSTATREPGPAAEELERLDHRRRELAAELELGPGDDPARERERYRQAQVLGAQLDGMKETRSALGDRVAIEEERRDLKEKRLDVLRLEQRQILADHPHLAGDPDYERRFRSEAPRIEERREELRRELLEAERRLAALPVEAGDPVRLAEELAALDRAREEAELERDAHRLAWRTLLGCKDEFVRVASARLARRIATVFEDLSGGRYTDVRIDPETLALYVDGPERLDVAAADLSRGAQDQLYFALRVAVLEGLAADRALPLVLDDPFLHFDEERLAHAGRTLQRLGARHQILLFTHDPRVAGWDFPQWVLPSATPAEIRPSID